MNPVRKALYDVLDGDATLKALAPGGVHYRKAPPNVPFPLVIFSKSTGNPLWAMQGEPMDKDTWLVKGVGKPAQAEAIDLRVKELLNRTTLNIEGKVNQDLRHVSDISYDEVIEGEQFDHVGAMYKLDSERNEP